MSCIQKVFNPPSKFSFLHGVMLNPELKIERWLFCIFKVWKVEMFMSINIQSFFLLMILESELLLRCIQFKKFLLRTWIIKIMSRHFKWWRYLQGENHWIYKNQTEPIAGQTTKSTSSGCWILVEWISSHL